MGRWLVMAVVAMGGLVLLGGFVLPVVGVASRGAVDTKRVDTAMVKTPAQGALFQRSVTETGIASAGALLLGVAPAAWLGSCRRKHRSVVLGLVMVPLLVPPQVYAYAWVWLTGDLWKTVEAWGISPAVQAGLISAGWLWPIPAMILASGWRTTGREVMTLAVLDTSAWSAMWRVVLPSLRSYIGVSGSLVFIVALLEYPIPHFALARVYATELLVLVDVGAPNGQVIRTSWPVMVMVASAVGLAWWNVRGTRTWGSLQEENALPMSERWTKGYAVVAAGVWLATMGTPIVLMARSVRNWNIWAEALKTFAEEWLLSLGMASLAGGLACVVVVTVILWTQALPRSRMRSLARWSVWCAVIPALLPPAVLGIGFVVTYNGADALRWFYTDTDMVWALALAARYSAAAVLVVGLSMGRRSMELIDQARSDGADSWAIVAHVLLPATRGPMVAAGLIVGLLAMFEVVVTQLVGPVGSSGIGTTLLVHMHYGRNDVVIATCLVIMGCGFVLTQICGRLLVSRRDV